MKDYANLIYRLELETGTYILDASFPEQFVEMEVNKPSYHHIHAQYEVVFACGKGGTEPRFFQINPPLCKHTLFLEDQHDPLYLFSIHFTVKKRQTAATKEQTVSNSVLEAFFALRDSVILPDTFRGQERIYAVQRELRERKNGYQEMAQAEMMLLLLEMARRLPRDQVTEQLVSANLDELKLDLIDEFFAQNYDRPDCRRIDLARILCISERQLSRIFAQNYGMSFRERLLQSRMEIAESLRKSERLSAEQLSERVGYSSASAFRAAYKNYFGRSFQGK